MGQQIAWKKTLRAALAYTQSQGQCIYALCYNTYGNIRTLFLWQIISFFSHWWPLLWPWPLSYFFLSLPPQSHCFLGVAELLLLLLDWKERNTFWFTLWMWSENALDHVNANTSTSQCQWDEWRCVSGMWMRVDCNAMPEHFVYFIVFWVFIPSTVVANNVNKLLIQIKFMRPDRRPEKIRCRRLYYIHLIEYVARSDFAFKLKFKLFI